MNLGTDKGRLYDGHDYCAKTSTSATLSTQTRTRGTTTLSMKYSPHPRRAPVHKVRLIDCRGGGGGEARVWNYRKADIDKGVTLQYYICAAHLAPLEYLGYIHTFEGLASYQG